MLYHNRRGMQQLISLLPLAPSSLPCHGSLLGRGLVVWSFASTSHCSSAHFCPAKSSQPLKNRAICPLFPRPAGCRSCSAHQPPVKRPEIPLHLASAAVSNGSTDINMTAHKRVPGHKGLACACTIPSFSCAAWVTHCTADASTSRW